MSGAKFTGIVAVFALLPAVRSIGWAQEHQTDTSGSKSVKTVTLYTISPYLPTAAAYTSNNAAGGIGIGSQVKQFDDLEVKLHDFKLADISIELGAASGSGTIYAERIESLGAVSGAGVTVDLWGGFAEISLSRLTGRIEACGSTTIPLTSDGGGGGGDSGDAVAYASVDGDGPSEFETPPDIAEVSYCLEGEVELLELNIKARLLRVDLRLGDGQWLYLAAGTTISIESYDIRFSDGRSNDGTSISVGGFIEAGITLSSSVRISVTATDTFTGTGHNTERDDGTFVTGGVSVGL